ncbi:hypothetical protein FRC03_011196 [Tulasnella sp. 419]|nr:hypothetical protein FRC03_011196 [Tulasnella sp. 419]
MPIVNVLTVRSYWDLHNSLLGAILSLGLTGTVTNLVKITVGRPRPDVIDRCQPREGSQNASPYGLVTAAICTQTDHEILKDGFRSFPSGHSSLSFAGLGFLSFYLAGKLHLWDKRGHTGKAWLSLAPLMGAALVAVSRTMDYRHHWQDVLTGSILGLTLSFFSYRQYYPPLTHRLSHQPFSPRIPRENAPLPTHRQDTLGGPAYIPGEPSGRHSPSSLSDGRSPSPPYRPGQPYAGTSSGLPPGAGYASAPSGMSLHPNTYQPNFPPQKQFSTPVNATPYEPRVYDGGADGAAVSMTVEPAPLNNPFENDQYRQPVIRKDGSPERGAGPEGTVPRPADHAAI